ncbi:MAG: RNA polymerase sigma factor [Pseudomonadota bacterium]
MSKPPSIPFDMIVNQRHWLQRLLGSRDSADDVIQTVCEKLLRSDVEPNQAYLNKMSRSAAIDTVRAETTRREYEQASAVFLDNSSTENPEQYIAAEQAVDALEAALAELGPLNREIFYRAYVACEPRAEIAKSLGFKISTIEKRLTKTRRHCWSHISSIVSPD